MNKDIDAFESTRDNVLRSFLQCFYVDHFGRLDIAWDRYIPFASLYTSLTTVYLPVKEPVQFKMDELRVFMLMSCVVGMIDNSIRSSVDDSGYVVINSIDLGPGSSVPPKIRSEYGFFKNHAQVTEETLHAGYAGYARSPIRSLCGSIYPSMMYETTHIGDVITKLITRIGILSFE